MPDSKNPIYSRPFDPIDDTDRARLLQILKERMKRNEELGLESSPENTSIEYGMTDPGVGGYVDRNNPSNIVISNKLMQSGHIPLERRENLVKYTTAHELDHVNRNAAIKNPKASTRYLDEEPGYGGSPHENPSEIVKPLKEMDYAGINEERNRILRSITHPSLQSKARPYKTGEPGEDESYATPYNRREDVGYTNALLKYAEQSGIPMDQIIDAMVTNSALRTDKLAREAHDKTKENMDQGILRKLLGKSTNDVYRPWKEMKEKRKK